jgi:invasion protein IalB
MIHDRFAHMLRLARPLILATVMMMPAAVMAQNAPAPAPAPAPTGPAAAPRAAAPAAGANANAPVSSDSRWIKVCGAEQATKKQLCQVIQELTAETGQFIASVNLQKLEGEPKMVFAVGVAMPATGVLVGPGMRAQIDDGKQYEVKFSLCFPDRCFADMQIDETFITAMKSGGNLTLLIATQQGAQVRALPIPLTLVGFTKAYDGAGVDPSAAQAMRDDLAKSLKAHADEARQKLLEEQQQARPPQ